jgi:colicin import membrane protein
LAVARKLKTFLTSLGFFDQAVAAPSMKAALQAWGADSNLFHQGFAREVDDPAIVEATMARPGVVLKRPIGSRGPFRESAELPAELPAANRRAQAKRPGKEASPKKIDAKAERQAALAFEREQEKRDRERQIEQARREKERARRDKAVARAQAALDAAEREHARKAAVIDRERDAAEKRSADEDARWRQLKSRLEAELRRARS